jgi:Raf kinase inhibitor-like YbhB/YbcL family protein
MIFTLVAIMSFIFFSQPGLAQKTGEASVESYTGHIVEPRKEKLKDISELNVPEGFKLSIFAENLINPRMLAVGDKNRIYVTRRKVGDVVLLQDSNGDGKSDSIKVVAHQPDVHGIVIDGNDVFLVTVKDVYTAKVLPDGSFSALTKIIDDLPDGGQHPNRTIGIGPDNQLYISVGSTCNACAETTPEAATLLVASKDGKKRRIYASGLRNTIGFAWHPQTLNLWGMDHNVDWHGDDNPPEELNEIKEGHKYGWPYVLGPTFLNPQDDPPGGITLEQWRDSSEAPALTYTAHAAPMQMAFHSGVNMPAEYAGNAFVAMRGSWNRSQPSGYEIVRIVFDESGKPASVQPWISGFLKNVGDKYTRAARPAGLVVTNDGAILFSDDENGVIYQVSYEGSSGSKIADSKQFEFKEAKPTPISLAVESLEKPPHLLKLKSLSFDANRKMPIRYSDYGDKISPALEWTQGPAGTKSFVIILDDPDAKPNLFNHWLVYNLSPDVLEIPEGLPTEPSIIAPIAAQQGLNSRYSSGYFGPRPPAGDNAHRYHFQVFALDKMLDLPPAPDRAMLLAAMKNHVLASGLLIGKFGRPLDIQSVSERARNIRRQ